MKVYSTLEEALKDIECVESPITYDYEMVKGSHEDLDRHWANKMDIVIMSLFEEYKKRELVWDHEFPHIPTELGRNGFRFSDFSLEIYFGKKGMIAGTIQEKDFFNDEQIQLLLSGNNVPSDAPNPGGHGTRVFVRSDGMFIDKEKKSIYVSQYFLEPSSE